MRTLVRWVKTLTITSRPFLIGTALSAVVGLVCYSVTSNTIEKDGYDRFTNLVHTGHNTILRRVKSYTDLLRGSASMFQAAPQLTREQFHRYVEGLHLATEFPGIESINYAERVTEAERPAFERRMAAELAAAGTNKPFAIAPPGRRDEYLVLTYIEPQISWESKLGVDVRAKLNAIAPLNLSRDTAVVAASGRPIPLITGLIGLGMRLPVYRHGMPTATVAERRAAYMGSVGIGFAADRLMSGVLADLPVRGMRMSLIGLADDRPGKPKERLLLYDSVRRAGVRGTDTPTPAEEDEYSLTLPIEFSQRNWEVHFHIKKVAMMDGIDVYAAELALVAGFVSTALLYALFHTMSSGRQRAVRLAEEMTRELRASEANLQLSNAKLRQLAAHAENIKEGERKRIAREIHDDLGQNLLALRIEADLLASRTGDRHPLLHERACRTLHQIDSTIKSVRQIINDLRPNVLDLGLNAAVDWQIAEFKRRTGISCDLIENDQDIQVNDRCATALFRILQESLTNISRHANASHVEVELLVRQDQISMSISDNGKGLQPGGRHKPGSFGLVGIEERVKILGGTFGIGSGQRGGTTVSVRVPLLEDNAVQRIVADSAATPAQLQNALV
jgi:signal transduction histidine kinase